MNTNFKITFALFAGIGLTASLLQNSFAEEGVDLKELPALLLPQDAALGEGLQTEISVKEIEALIPWAKSTRESLRDGMAFVEQNEVKPERQVARLMAIFQDIVKTSSPQASEMLFRYLMNRSIKLIEVDNALTGTNSMGGDWSRRADFLKKMGAQSLKFLEDELLWLGGLKEDTKFQKRDLAGFGVKSFSLLLSYSRQIINAKAQAKALWLTMAWLRQDLYDPEQRESSQKFAREIIRISNVLKTVGNPDSWATDLDDDDHLANYRALLAVALQIHVQVNKKIEEEHQRLIVLENQKKAEILRIEIERLNAEKMKAAELKAAAELKTAKEAEEQRLKAVGLIRIQEKKALSQVAFRAETKRVAEKWNRRLQKQKIAGVFLSGAQLNVDEQIHSPNGLLTFTLQADGNLVLKNSQGVLWHSNTADKGGAKLVFQSDGNVVLYSATSEALWSSQTQGKDGVYLAVQDDGNVVIYTVKQEPVWSTQTRADGTVWSQNSLGMKFVPIQSGTFMMGSPAGETDRVSEEVQHEVTLTKSFEIQTTEVTQDQWSSLMGNNPSLFKGPTSPVENVSWDDAQDFIQKLNQKPEIIKEGYTYRLPTEAEWEYAARGGQRNGKTTTFAYGDGTKQVSDLGWYNGNSENKTHPVMTKKDAYGLFDMHGNVLEWTQDWYGDYPTASVTDPTGPSSGSNRVLRGGSWAYVARGLRSAFRYYGDPSTRFTIVGFRLVRTR